MLSPCSWMGFLTLLVSRRPLKEYGVTLYPVTPHQLLQPAGQGEVNPGWPNQKSKEVSLGKKPHPQNPQRQNIMNFYAGPVISTWNRLWHLSGLYPETLAWGRGGKLWFLWLGPPHHYWDNKHEHVSVFCVMWAPAKLVWNFFFPFFFFPRNHKRYNSESQPTWKTTPHFWTNSPPKTS